MLWVAYALLVGGALAHYGESFDRNLLERNEPDHEGVDLVECPVCEGRGAGWISGREECPVVKGGKRYKRCPYGVYLNRACGNRLDCFRGPRDRCSEKLTDDPLDQRCARGFYCNPALGVCTGPGYDVDAPVMRLLVPNHYFSLEDRRRPADSFNYPIRERRAI